MGSTTTKYLLNGTQILAQKTGNTILSFFYDQQGNRVAMADSSNKFYYYIYNLQGDVIALADASTGKLAATYTYDAWGKCTVTNATGFTIGTDNPFRYRGYYYDTETKLYYLQTRYYDPGVGRFINADAFTSTDISGALSANMFAYCENNPVMRHDPNGEWAQILVGAVIGVLEQFVSDVAVAALTGQPLDQCFSSVGTYVSAALGGAISTYATFTKFTPLQRGVQEAITTSVGTYVDTAVEYITNNVKKEDKNGRILRDSVKSVGSKQVGNVLTSKAKGKGLFGAVIRTAGDHVGSILRICERTAKHWWNWLKK